MVKESSKRPTKVLDESMELFIEPKTERAVLTVSQITELIKGTLESDFHDIWVEGEVSNSKVSQAGHIYFSLKDEESVLSCVMFRQTHMKIKFEIEDGLHIIIHGRISVYEARGQYQLIADKVEVAGLGALQQAFEQLKEKLQKEGLFDPAHKRPLPLLPQRIGIVTSPTGAAIRDIFNVLHRRYANLEIIIAPTLVQGPQAAGQIVEAINNLNQIENIDVIIVTRGGGSLEDLWPFNEEIVARTIYHSHAPVISAVGHEIDFTISDFVADLRAPTPSAAAELVVKNKEELEMTVNQYTETFIRILEDMIENYKDQIDSLLSRPVFTQPVKTLESHMQRVDDLSDRLERHILHELGTLSNQFKNFYTRLNISSPYVKIIYWKEKLVKTHKMFKDGIHRQLTDSKQKLESQMAHLNALSPLAVLGRGYSITFRLPEKMIVKSIEDVNISESLEIKVNDGTIQAKVNGKEKENDGTNKK